MLPAIKKYPHLHPDDNALWNAFLPMLRNPQPPIDYDVNVGSGRDPGEHYDKKIRAMALGLSQRRIDAVIHTPIVNICVEISPKLGWRTIGQAFGYPILYQLSYPSNLWPIGLILCEQVETDLFPCCTKLKIPIVLIDTRTETPTLTGLNLPPHITDCLHL